MENEFYSPVTPKNNTLAIISLVLSLAGIPFLCLSFITTFCACFAGLTGIAALITGFLARQQIKSTGEQGDGMALIGMIFGGIQVVLVICIAIFAVVLISTGLIGSIFSSINSSLK